MNNKTKCILQRKIDHSNMREQFKNNLVFCPLFERPDIGMTHIGIICGACCIRCQMVGESLADMILKGKVNLKDLERDPQCFFQHLPEELKEYAEVVTKMTGRTWEEIRRICHRCKPMLVNPPEAPKADATKMSYIARRDV